MFDNSDNNINGNVTKTFFNNRGINDYVHYMHLNKSAELPYSNLCNIDSAVQLFDKHYKNKNPISILVDEDVDGFCSASEIYLYIKKMDPDYPLSYILHGKTKAHGLTNDVIVPENTMLLIIPDAGTNDNIQCNTLYEKSGIDILILDHHEQEKSQVQNKYAVIVNNQISINYSNKQLCGAGIVYKFLQALDDYYWQEYADEYIDLCALANISDVMDIRSFETKYLIDKGIKNIKNKCFQALIHAQDYSMGGHINIHNIQWYITPILNGCIRFGSTEEKELLFKAFIETDEMFEYKKRATKDKPSETIDESIYDRAARLCKNAKSRQDKAREKCTKEVIECLNQRENNSKVIVYDASLNVDHRITGVVAIKIAEKMNRPCILLQKHIKKDNTMVYGGSARNINYSPIESLKDVINSTGIAVGKGHANAFGIVDLPINHIDELENKLNDILSDVQYDATFKCDYIVDVNFVTPSFVSTLASFQDYLGQGIEEPIIAIENIILTRDDFLLIGKNEDTIKFSYGDIEYVKFRCKEDDALLSWIKNCWESSKELYINIVGKPGINQYNGVKTMQVIIEDVEIIKENDCESSNNEEESIWD